MPFIILIVAIVLLMVIMLRKKKKRKSAASASGTAMSTENDSAPGSGSTPAVIAVPPSTARQTAPLPGTSSASPVRYSRDFLKEEEEEHVTVQVFCSLPAQGIWVCPNCETENPDSEAVCCVCHRKR